MPKEAVLGFTSFGPRSLENGATAASPDKPPLSRTFATGNAVASPGCSCFAAGAKVRPTKRNSFIRGPLMATVENRALKSAAAGINDDIGEETRLRLYRSQVLLRDAEQRAFDLFLQNLVKGTSHLSLGQEAVAAGFGVRHAAGRPLVLHLSRPCTHAGARRAGREGLGRADAARQRVDARQGRLDASHLRRARRDGLLRHHRCASADRLRRGVARAIQRHQGRVGLLLRRRHHQYRCLPRGAQFRGGVEAAGGLRVREQSLHGVHADRLGDGGGAAGGGSRRRPTAWSAS